MATHPFDRDPKAAGPPPPPPAPVPPAPPRRGPLPAATRGPVIDTRARQAKAPPASVRQAAPPPVDGDPIPPAEASSEPLSERLLRDVPAWLVSAIFHMLLILLLALITLPSHIVDVLNLEVDYATSSGEQLETLQLSSFESLGDDTELSLDTFPTLDPLAAPPEVPPSDIGLTLSTEIEAPSIGFALTGRNEGSKQGLLAAYGGTAGTEAAVARGLAWLKRQQQKDGTWRLDGPYSDAGFGENRTAATAMALIAFQGAGHTHQTGEHKAVVQRGIRALLKIQDNDGNFFHEGIAHHRLYSHALATIAVCELYGMTKDESLREPAEKAIDYCCRTQAPEGGWRYEPRVDSDTSVTGWFVMALQSGRMAGLNVPSTTLQNVERFLDSVALEGGSRYSYRPGENERISMTAEGLLCRQYLGWKRDDTRLVRGVHRILEVPIDFSRINYYYWYYAAQVLHHYGGPEWFQWNNVMRVELPARQVSTGPEAGSWDPSGDPHDGQGGRLYTTCLAIYMLEVYYRHLPIYKSL